MLWITDDPKGGWVEAAEELLGPLLAFRFEADAIVAAECHKADYDIECVPARVK